MKKVIQIAHITETPGPVQTLAQFIGKKPTILYKIYHPLENHGILESVFATDQKIIAKKKYKKHNTIGYLNDFFLTLRWLNKITKPLDIAIGMNCFDTLPLLLFRKRLAIKKIIFFNTDYSRHRFDNEVLNMIYVFIDKYCARKADFICCNTQRTIKARINEGVDRKRLLFTPNGVFFNSLGKVASRKNYKKSLFYAGHISKEHGLQEVIKLLANFNISLTIAGNGEYESKLKRLVKKLRVGKKIKFLGRIEHDEVIKRLKVFSGFGLAPYNVQNEWTKYCDPVKVKEYLSCSVPVVISNVPEVAHLIKEKELGFVYDNETDLLETIKLITRMKQREYQKLLDNIKRVRNNFNLEITYEKIWQKALG